MVERGGGDDRRVGDAHAVVDFVALFQAAQDGNGILDRRLIDKHRLEATLQGGVLLDVLAVFIQRRRADGMQLAAGQQRFSMLLASMAPWAAPAPIRVCISSMNRMISPSAS